MFDSYLELGGNEILNGARVYGYTTSVGCGVSWVKCEPCEGLRQSLADEPYTIENIEDAPWYDVESEPTHRFYGAYPISIENFTDSTRTATVAEGILDGGTVGLVRHATRQMTVRALLIAQGMDALEAGFSWLDAALQPSSCSTHGDSCGAVDMCFYTTCPPERRTVQGYTPWLLYSRNVAPNPRAITTASFYGEAATTSLALITTFPSDVTTAIQATRTNPAGNVGVSVMIGAEYTADTVYRVRFELNASVAGTLTLQSRPSVVNPAINAVMGTYAFEAGLNNIDIIGTTLASGGTPGIAQSGFTILTDAGATGATFQITKIVIERTAGPYSPDFFDGNTPDTDLENYEWSGTVNNSVSLLQRRTAVLVPQSDEEYQADVDEVARHMHSVTATAGPTIEQQLVRGNTYAYIVEFTLVAAVPWVFSTTKELPLSGSGSVVIDDVPYNLIPVPNAALPDANVVIATNYSTNPSLETNATGWTATATPFASEPAVAAYFTSGRVTGEVAAAGTSSFRARILGNGSTTVTDGQAQVVIAQTVALPAVTGRRFSFSVWAAALVIAGPSASRIDGMYAQARWLDSGGTPLGTVPLGSATRFDGWVFSAKQNPAPATATQALIEIITDVTWGSSATASLNSDVRVYGDALAVTIP